VIYKQNRFVILKLGLGILGKSFLEVADTGRVLGRLVLFCESD